MPAAKPSFPRLLRSKPLAQGLVVAWTLHEGNGLTANDLSGLSHNGTLTSGVSWSASPFGYAVSFNGTSGQITTPSPFINYPFSLVALVNDTTPASQGTILSNDSDAFNGWRLTVGRSGSYPDIVNNNVAGQSFTTLTMTANKDYFLCVTATTSTIVGYLGDIVAGTLKAESQAYALGTPFTSCNTLRAGSLSGSNFWSGRMSNVLVYNRALSSAEVAALYADPFQMFRPSRTILKAAAAPAGAATQFLSCLGCGA